MQKRDVVLSIDGVVEPGLINAIKTHSKELGYPLIGIAIVDKSYVDHPDRHKDESGFFTEIAVDFDSPDELQKALKPYMDRVFAATTRYEDATRHFSKVVPFLPYSFTPTESGLIWATEKPQMRDRLKAYDEDLVPRYIHLHEKDLPQLDKLLRDFTFPVIIKPGSLWSQMLVAECKTHKELKEKLEHVFQLIHDVYNFWLRETEPGVLVEEMMQGVMYTTDAYVRYDGTIFCLPFVKVIVAHSLGLPGFYDYRIIAPVDDLSDKDIREGVKAAKAAVKAINLRSSSAHIEMFKTKHGWKIIELAARIGGSREAIYREAYGIEHHYNDIAIRAGLLPKMPEKIMKHVYNELIFADKEGIIESIDGVEEARKLSSAVLFDVEAKPGDRALFAPNGGEGIINVILSNKDKKQLDKDALRMREVINIKIADA